jgi:hypothetical protein
LGHFYYGKKNHYHFHFHLKGSQNLSLIFSAKKIILAITSPSTK